MTPEIRSSNRYIITEHMLCKLSDAPDQETADKLANQIRRRLTDPSPSSKKTRNWKAIEKEILRAILASTKTQFAGSRDTYQHIAANPSSFPILSKVYHVTVKSWVTMYCTKYGWTMWTSGKNSGNQKIFVIPEDIRK